MTRLRIASAVAIMAFLAVPVGMTAWSQDKADPKAAGGDENEHQLGHLNVTHSENLRIPGEMAVARVFVRASPRGTNNRVSCCKRPRKVAAEHRPRSR